MKILLKQAIVYPITSQKFQGDVLVIGEKLLRSSLPFNLLKI